jgi:hypothetical protein
MNSTPTNAYDVFNAVDQLVAKPVLGSDGASAWQDFKSQNEHTSSLQRKQSVAPTAPLKAADRSAGFSSWHQERQNEVVVRALMGNAPLGAGYTDFKQKPEDAAQRKRHKQIEARVRPDDVPYFVSSSGAEGGFSGWKFDYIFTTRDRGTGYYWDGMDSVKKMRGELDPQRNDNKPEVASSLSSSVPPTTSRPDNDSEADPTEKMTKKKKRKKLAGPVFVNDPNNPLEQVAAALQRRQSTSTTDLLLPPGWQAAMDTTSKSTYYYNTKTGERSWERPGGDASTNLPDGWSLTLDVVSGRDYYYNADTKETRWDKPPAL